MMKMMKERRAVSLQRRAAHLRNVHMTIIVELSIVALNYRCPVFRSPACRQCVYINPLTATDFHI